MNATIDHPEAKTDKPEPTCPPLASPGAGLRPGTCRPLADWLRRSIHSDALRQRIVPAE